jgi:hypothetical protein
VGRLPHCDPNVVRVAFSNSIDGNQLWVRYPYPLIRHPELPLKKGVSADSPSSNEVWREATQYPGVWRVGQPAATAIKGSRVLLAYTAGDHCGTRTELRTVDFANLDSASAVFVLATQR